MSVKTAISIRGLRRTIAFGFLKCKRDACPACLHGFLALDTYDEGALVQAMDSMDFGHILLNRGPLPASIQQEAPRENL